jgi:hypothetical protein
MDYVPVMEGSLTSARRSRASDHGITDEVSLDHYSVVLRSLTRHPRITGRCSLDHYPELPRSLTSAPSITDQCSLDH